VLGVEGSTLTDPPSQEVEQVTLVDAENVRRSEWPNIGREELIDLVRTWAEATGAHALLVFDGPAPAVAGDGETLKVVGTAAESADDRIARDAEALARAGRPYRLVTSDRGLRERAAAAADDVVGGGTFARTLRALTRVG
jgi:predicted RNA-binding protein with PIN domain